MTRKLDFHSEQTKIFHDLSYRIQNYFFPVQEDINISSSRKELRKKEEEEDELDVSEKIKEKTINMVPHSVNLIKSQGDFESFCTKFEQIK